MREGSGNAVIDLIRVFYSNATNADRFRHSGKIRVVEFGPKSEEAGRFLLELDETERTVVENDDFYRELKLYEADEIAHQHGEATVAR